MLQNDAVDLTTWMTNAAPLQDSDQGRLVKEALCLEDHLHFLSRLVAARERGEDVGYGPIHFAASLGNVGLVDYLLNAGFDKDERDRDGNSPLMWVLAYDGHEELMDSLVDHGASVNIQNFLGESPLFLACQRGMLSKANYLLDNGADVNVMNLDGAFPLHTAAARGDTELISLLVKYGAHINAADDEGDSPLHWAVREGNVKAACLLVHLGADVNFQNEDGESPLDLALCTNDKELARDLAFVYQHSVVYSYSTGNSEDDVLDMSSGLQDLWLQEKKGPSGNLVFGAVEQTLPQAPTAAFSVAF